MPPSVRQSSVRQSMASPEPEAATGLETPPARLSQHTEYDEEWNEVHNPPGGFNRWDYM